MFAKSHVVFIAATICLIKPSLSKLQRTDRQIETQKSKGPVT